MNINTILLIFGFIITLSYPYVAKKVKWLFRKSSKRIIAELTQNEVLFAALSNIGNTVTASRVAIIVYEGVTASMHHEWTSPDTNKILNFFQKIRTSPLTTMLLELEVAGMVVVNANSGYDLVMIHRAIGVDTSYKFKLFNSIAEGVLVVAFAQPTQLTSDQLKYIDEQLTRVRLLYHKKP